MLIKRKSIEKEESQREPRNVVKRVADAIVRARKPKFAPVTLSEQEGIRYLHFGTEWVQGAMRLRKPDWLELEYAQQMMAWMLFIEKPAHVVQLGLGTASLTKFCYRTLHDTRVTAVELNPAVINICAAMFKLPPADARLQVLEMDAFDFVLDEANHASIDALQVDLYDATARGPVLDTSEFYSACAACLKEDGVLTVNLFGDHPSFKRNIRALGFAFGQVVCLPEVHDGNVIAIAFKKRRHFDFDALAERAKQIKLATKLPAQTWVAGLQAD